MSKRNRERRERNRATNQPEPRHESGPQRLRRLLEVPTAVDYVEGPHLRLAPDADPEPFPPPMDAEENVATGPGSRANAVRQSLRSKILFPLDVLNNITKLFDEYSITIAPVGALESYLVRELARCSVQDEKAFEQLLVNDLRQVEKVGSSWDLERSVNVAKLGATLRDSPQVVAETLESSKHGVLYMIRQWSFIQDIIKTKGTADEGQRQVMFDLLGVDPIYRNGCSLVPAGTDTPGLSTLVAGQLTKLRTRLERVLNDCDASERGMAMLGIVASRDSTTKLLRADQNRARRRFSWCLQTIKELRAGAHPSTLIDPETGRGVVPGPPLVAVTPPARPASAPVPAPPPPPPPPAPAAPAEPSIPALPEGLPADAKEMFLVVAGAIQNMKAASAADEPEPPPTA